jgi:hypothetical protein
VANLSGTSVRRMATGQMARLSIARACHVARRSESGADANWSAPGRHDDGLAIPGRRPSAFNLSAMKAAWDLVCSSVIVVAKQSQLFHPWEAWAPMGESPPRMRFAQLAKRSSQARKR